MLMYSVIFFNSILYKHFTKNTGTLAVQFKIGVLSNEVNQAVKPGSKADHITMQMVNN